MGQYANRPFYNDSLPVLASGVRTAAPTIADQLLSSAQGIHVILDVTDIGILAPSITITISGVDGAGKVHTLLVGAAVASVSTTRYTVHPLATAVANSVARDMIGKLIRISVAHDNTDPITYSIGMNIGVN